MRALRRCWRSACARLDRQASQISDATCRQAFWEDVPTHRALLAARAAQEGKLLSTLGVPSLGLVEADGNKVEVTAHPRGLRWRQLIEVEAHHRGRAPAS